MAEVIDPVIVVSLLITSATLALWVDFAVYQARLFHTHRHAHVLRDLGIGVGVVLVVILMGASVVVEYLTPGDAHYIALMLLSAARMIVLTTGLWLAIDRRIHP